MAIFRMCAFGDLKIEILNRLGHGAHATFADFVIVDRDLLRCPLDDLKNTRVLQTWVEGRLVYESK